MGICLNVKLMYFLLCATCTDQPNKLFQLEYDNIIVAVINVDNIEVPLYKKYIAGLRNRMG